MYLVPFSMGPVGGPLSKNGVELTDSAYVAVSMRVMTRVSTAVLDSIVASGGGGDFVKCLHSVGHPLPTPDTKDLDWPCNPEKVIIAHRYIAARDSEVSTDEALCYAREAGIFFPHCSVGQW